MLQTLKESVQYLKLKINGFEPEIGIVLGTGLGGLVNEITDSQSVMYSSIPNFPISTLEFHSGKLIFGMLKGKRVVAMQGRLHYYEGYSMQQITFPIRVLKALGIKCLLVF
jgi:purine-nucleoside phosphorylase